MKFTAITIPLVLVLAIAAAGCGSKKSATDTGTSGTTTAVVTTAAAAPTTSSTTAGGELSFATTKNCAQLMAMGQKFSQAMAASSGKGTASIAATAKAYKALADAAPSAIRSDFQTLATAFTAYADAMQQANLAPGKIPTAAQMGVLAAAAKSFSTAKVTAASQHLSAWSAKNCHA